MKRYRLFSLLLAAVLFVAAPPHAAAQYEAFAHPDVPFSDMAYRGIDPDAADVCCARFLADPPGEYEALVALYDEIYTQRELAALRMYENPDDEALAAESERASADFSRAADAIYLALSEALAGADGAALAALMPEGEAEAFSDYAPSDKTDFAALDEENALVQAYYSLPYDDDFEENAAALYLRLVAVRRDEAARAGYDSYADYAYAALNAREYDSADTRALARVVRERLAPLYVRCMRALDRRDMPWDDEDTPGDAEILDALRAHMGEVAPELCEALDYLCRNGLYRIGGAPLYDTGFTTLLPSYRAPFLFNHVEGRFAAFQSTVHEFGHFNAMYHDPTPMLYQYAGTDVSEIQSQALELLFIPSLADILVGGDEAGRDYVTLYAVAQLLSSVVDGCMYDEFEQAVYENESLTPAALNTLEESLCRAYGLDALYDYEPFWCYIPHLFDQPFYYVSYAASALPALHIWLRSLDDRAAAAQTYLRVSEARTDAWFLDVLYDNDLCDVTNPAEVERLVRALNERLNPLIAPEASPAPYYAAAALALAVGVGAIAIRKRKNKA